MRYRIAARKQQGRRGYFANIRLLINLDHRINSAGIARLIWLAGDNIMAYISHASRIVIREASEKQST
jgi:hypothetical protein